MSQHLHAEPSGHDIHSPFLNIPLIVTVSLFLLMQPWMAYESHSSITEIWLVSRSLVGLADGRLYVLRPELVLYLSESSTTCSLLKFLATYKLSTPLDHA